MKNEIHAIGLDIGTSRVRCVVGEASDDGLLKVVGIGRSESRGLRRGIVTGAEAVAESIRKALDEAERVSGLEIKAATVNLSGEHFRGENKNGVVAVAGAGREISSEDVERAVESACAVQLPSGWEVFDRVAQEFIIDGQDGITEPIGMSGSRLEALVHVVTGPSAGRQNLEKAVRRAGIDAWADDQPIAAAESTLTDDDREYGCAVVNIGSEITSLKYLLAGERHSTPPCFLSEACTSRKTSPSGFAFLCRRRADIKHVHDASASFLMDDNERAEMIEITPVGRSETRGLSKEILCDIMQPRHRLLSISRARLQRQEPRYRAASC